MRVNKIKNNNKKKKLRRTQTKPVISKGAIQSTGPTFNNAVEFRKIPQDRLLTELKTYQKHIRDRYLTGLVHPDLAVKEGIQLKAYSDLPIPSTTIGFHVQSYGTTNSSGAFMVSWRPSCLRVNGDASVSNVTFNNSAALTGTVATAGNFFLAADSINPAWAFGLQRYRLVSALLKVSYNGSVLNQSGTLLSCATMDPFPVGNTSLATADPLVDRFGNYSLIANGLWNQTVNITKDSEGLECLYLPIDPADLIFEQQGSYQGVAYPGSGTASPARTGAPINYVVAGRNLPASAQCVIIDLYYNYEVIVDPNSATFMRQSTENTVSYNDHIAINREIRDSVYQSGMIRQTKSRSWTDILGQVAEVGIKYLPTLLSMI